MRETVILALDPGPTQSAYVRWDGTKVLEKGIAPNKDVLEIVQYDACWVDRLAIEMIACYGMAVGAETFETCVWIGRFMERWAWHAGNETIQRLPRLDIKVHLCKSARAKDANVRQALIDRFGMPGTRKTPGPLFGVTSHCWSALAVGVCAYDRIAAGDFDFAGSGVKGSPPRPRQPSAS